MSYTPNRQTIQSNNQLRAMNALQWLDIWHPYLRTGHGSSFVGVVGCAIIKYKRRRSREAKSVE